MQVLSDALTWAGAHLELWQAFGWKGHAGPALLSVVVQKLASGCCWEAAPPSQKHHLPRLHHQRWWWLRPFAARTSEHCMQSTSSTSQSFACNVINT